MTRQEQMFALVEEAEQSKQTISAFCSARDINIKTFFYWRRKFLASRSVPAGFIPIIPNASPVNTEKSDIRVAYPNGVSIHLQAPDVSLIAQLIRLV